MSLLPSVRAKLVDRFIFNFRLPAAFLRTKLPVPWLTPQEVKGFAVASYCILRLENVTVAPLPAKVGLSNISCAHRFAVVDESGSSPTSAVYVVERQTDSAFGAWFSSLGFPARHPLVHAAIEQRGDETDIRVQNPSDMDEIFFATVRPTRHVSSVLFETVDEFREFIAAGVKSYGPSRHGEQLTKVDLKKEDEGYEPLEALRTRYALVAGWEDAVFDSAFRTGGGQYEWAYRGLTD